MAATVSDFIVLGAEQFELPHLATGYVDGFTAIKDFIFDLPVGTQSQGVLCAEILTVHGMEDHVDLEFSVFGGAATWNSSYGRSEFLSRLWTVQTKPGSNSIRFQLNRGGAIETSKGSFTVGAGGAGRLRIANVILWYRRT